MRVLENIELVSPALAEMMERVLARLASTNPYSTIRVIEINNWFGPKWLGFSGNSIGVISAWLYQLTPPPFHPHRVWSDTIAQYDFTSKEWTICKPKRPMHRMQTSVSNFDRKMKDIAPAIPCVWCGVDAALNSRAAMMAYFPDESKKYGYQSWYVGLEKYESWKPCQLRGIEAEEFTKLIAVI